MKELTKKLCWELVSINKDTINGIGAAIYKKPTNNECYEQRSQNDPPICDKSDDPNAAWYSLYLAVNSFYSYQLKKSAQNFLSHLILFPNNISC